jgi:ParB family chromosome partitioning protein
MAECAVGRGKAVRRNRKNIPAEARNLVFVTLPKLKKSPKNVRKVPHSKAEVAALAASIASLGLLQFPVVEPEPWPEGQAHRQLPCQRRRRPPPSQ